MGRCWVTREHTQPLFPAMISAFLTSQTCLLVLLTDAIPVGIFKVKKLRIAETLFGPFLVLPLLAAAESGAWIIKYDDNDSEVKVVCNQNGSGTYYLDGASYPAKCSSSGNSLKIEVWSSYGAMSQYPPAVAASFTIDGDSIFGSLTKPQYDPARGRREGTQGLSASQLAAERNSEPYSSTADTRSEFCKSGPTTPEQYEYAQNPDQAKIDAQVKAAQDRQKRWYEECGSGPSKVTVDP